MRLRALPAALCTGVAVLTATACTSAGASGRVQLSLVAYSTPQGAYEKLITAFQATPAGRDVRFHQSYGASGDQSRAVGNGLAADVVSFSLTPDVTRLVRAGLVAPSWDSDAHHGIVTDSVVALVVRHGNPHHITDWSDLARPGIKVVTPNPFSSGSAQWNLMGALGAQLTRGRSAAQAEHYLTALLRNTVVQDQSGRKALQTFTSGTGDVLISYENEAVFARQKGQPVDYVVPSPTLLIENPIAVTTSSDHPREAAAFVRFLHSAPAQRILAHAGFRPIQPGVDPARYRHRTRLFRIADLGGWPAVTKKYFDPDAGVVARAERSLGVSVAKR